MDPNLSPFQLFTWTYGACAWCSFGLYAISTDDWSVKRCFAATIHGANCGCICALLGVRWIGIDKPFEVIGIACSASIGWTKKELILELIARVLKK